MTSGIWQVAIRANGQPVGGHALEILVPESAKPARPQTAVEAPRPPTLDQLYQHRRSVVSVHKLDSAGRRIDTSTGFVFAVGQVMTSFQSIDGGVSIEVEFDDGRRESTADLLAYSRRQDWAVLGVPTAAVPAFQRSQLKAAIGDRLIVFVKESNGRTIGGIDLSGRQQVPGASTYLLLSPEVDFASVGEPVLDVWGHLAGMLVGNLVPGSRTSSRSTVYSPELHARLNSFRYAIPIDAIPEAIEPKRTAIIDLIRSGDCLRPVIESSLFVSAGAASKLPDIEDGHFLSNDSSRFARTEPVVWIYSFWVNRAKRVNGLISLDVYDLDNRVRVSAAPKKVRFYHPVPNRYALSFAPASLPAGLYRVDLKWNGDTVWRSFVEITE